MKLLYGNFDFEHQLEAWASEVPSASLRQIHAELAYTLVALAEADDLVWTPRVAEADYGAHLETIGLPPMRFVTETSRVPKVIKFQPWGWSTPARDWAAKHGWQFEHPDLEVVRKVNSREFSVGLEQEWGVAPRFARAIFTRHELQKAIQSLPAPNAAWVVKANFGMSARQRILGRGPSLPTDSLRWVEKQLAHGTPVFFEPWLDRVEEVGFQFTVPRTGNPVLEGVTGLLTDSQGTYRGSRLTAQVDFDAHSVIERAVRRIQGLGYFGPLGIDAMKFRASDGATTWRPLQDINARWTMGRLALGLRRLVPPNACASWLHVRFDGMTGEICQKLLHLDRLLPDGVRATRTSPLQVGDKPTRHGAILVTATSETLLTKGERTVADVLT